MAGSMAAGTRKRSSMCASHASESMCISSVREALDTSGRRPRAGGRSEPRGEGSDGPAGPNCRARTSDVHAALRPAGELPHQPGVDGAEQRAARLRGGAQAGHVVQQPAQLRAGEVGGQRQARALAHAVLAQRVGGGQLRAQVLGARVLPHDGVMQRLAAVRKGRARARKAYVH